ncbi:uncharacterized protein DUF4123 [Litoreibacter ponti]|uniref:Uncharacterized protein DUF4123 n=1 Tax=Litoreibacter ponti TaxID=1510457 RepID=A0A2T6BLK0_9RHOB|nr:DUF4123 domain-containing protein [Litoreibacter ponti]PTX56954.1 uncharacterized protein DUF4123 [Litoreibacter ponti]
MNFVPDRTDDPIKLHIQPLGRIDPLAPQFGPDAKQSVPEGLVPYLFEGDAEGAAYLVLDGAHLKGGLQELLANSGLAHACLLSGKAQEEQSLTAPWIVRLERENRFTRDVFTHDPQKAAPWHLWRHAPGLLLRSPADLDTLRRHFRKFLRIADAEGKAYFLRFWECGPLLEYLRRADRPSEIARMWLRTATGHPIELILPISGYCYHCTANGRESTGAPRGTLQLSDHDVSALYDGTLRARASRILYRMERFNPDVFADLDREALIIQAIATIKRMIGYRITSGIELDRAVRLEVLLRMPLEAWDKSGRLLAILGSDLRESRKMDLVEAHVDEVFAEPIGA